MLGIGASILTGISRMQSIKFVYSLLVILIAVTASSSATTYYVDAVYGNDAYNGISTSTAWKTLAKVNFRSFLAGDQILLRRGQTWRETLNVTSSGTATSRITYGAYGTGINPVLDEQAVRWPAVKIAGKSYVTVTNLTLVNSSNAL